MRKQAWQYRSLLPQGTRLLTGRLPPKAPSNQTDSGRVFSILLCRLNSGSSMVTSTETILSSSQNLILFH